MHEQSCLDDEGRNPDARGSRFSQRSKAAAWIGGLACAGVIPFSRRSLPWWLVLPLHWLVVFAACRVVSRWDLIPTVLGSLGLVGGGWVVIEGSARLAPRRRV